MDTAGRVRRVTLVVHREVLSRCADLIGLLRLVRDALENEQLRLAVRVSVRQEAHHPRPLVQVQHLR